MNEEKAKYAFKVPFTDEYLSQAASRRSKLQQQLIKAGSSASEASIMATMMVAREDNVDFEHLSTALAQRAVKAKIAKRRNGKTKAGTTPETAIQLPLAGTPTTLELLQAFTTAASQIANLLSQMRQENKRLADALWAIANRKGK